MSHKYLKRHLLVMLALFVLLSTLPAGCSSAPENYRVAFLSDRNGETDIYVSDPDGSNPVNITTDTEAYGHPVWSPDGSKIAFIFESRGDNLYIANADGSSTTAVTDNPTDDTTFSIPNFAWSPDSSRILLRYFNLGIYAINVDGSNLTRFVDLGSYGMSSQTTAVIMQWSPDGTRIIFCAEVEEELDIYVMNSDGSNLVKLTSSPDEDDWPQWSPDGSTILFRSFSEDGYWNWYMMNSDGSGQQKLIESSLVPLSASWSPDGNKIVFDGATAGVWTDRKTYVINSDCSDLINLTENKIESSDLFGYPIWSPDSAKIMLLTLPGDGWEIYVVDSDGSGFARIADTEDQPIPAWSPDSKTVFYTSGDPGAREISRVGSNGRNTVNTTQHAADDYAPACSPLIDSGE